MYLKSLVIIIIYSMLSIAHAVQVNPDRGIAVWNNHTEQEKFSMLRKLLYCVNQLYVLLTALSDAWMKYQGHLFRLQCVTRQLVQSL